MEVRERAKRGGSCIALWLRHNVHSRDGAARTLPLPGTSDFEEENKYKQEVITTGPFVFESGARTGVARPLPRAGLLRQRQSTQEAKAGSCALPRWPPVGSATGCLPEMKSACRCARHACRAAGG